MTMTVDAVLSQVSSGLERRDKARRASWLALVRAVCDGKAPPADKIEATLGESGKTIDELRQACGLLARRRDAQADIEAADAARAELPGIDGKVAEAQQELNRAKEKFRAAVAPLNDRRQQLEQVMAKRSRALETLRTTADESLSEREAELNARRAELQQRREKLMTVADNAEHNAGIHETNAAQAQSKEMYFGSDETAKLYRQNKGAASAQAADECHEKARQINDEQLPQLDAEIDAITAELAQIEKEKLQP